MTDRYRQASVDSESAILIGVILPHSPPSLDPLAELKGLAETVGLHVSGQLVQRRAQPSGSTYLGRGKVDELAALAADLGADVILFDNELTPAQTRNLEKVIGVKVLDRTELILDIFATHARTYESRLAVELAQLEYALPRLKQMWTHLSRIKMGVGMRGPGEKQLEVDRRLVEKRIHDLRTELRIIEQRKERQVAARRDHMTVSLVGYTNAGKSTLMNALTGAGVLTEDKLFATLDTRTRRWQLPHWGPVLLSDTVGFIRDLPLRLIASFKATLEEARQADLLLHVADASNPHMFDQVASVYGVLGELGIDEKDTLLVVNKIDALASRSRISGITNRYPNAVAVSARTEENLDRLALAVSDALTRSFGDIDVEMDVHNGRLMAYIAAHGEILSRRYDGERVTIHCRLPQRFAGRIRESDAQVRPHGGAAIVAAPPAGVDASDSVEDVA